MTTTRALLTSIVVVGCATLVSSAQAPQRSTAGAGAYTAPRNVFGQPDFEGVWTNNSLTPLQRPAAWANKATLSEEEGSEVLHVDFGDPYTPSLRAQILAAAQRGQVAVVDGGCYGATQGPRLETKAEIARMKRDGCDLVGMTGMPEAGLARELGLSYACLGIVANWAAGCGDSAEITMEEVLANVDAASAGLLPLLQELLTG